MPGKWSPSEPTRNCSPRVRCTSGCTSRPRPERRHDVCGIPSRGRSEGATQSVVSDRPPRNRSDRPGRDPTAPGSPCPGPPSHSSCSSSSCLPFASGIVTCTAATRPGRPRTLSGCSTPVSGACRFCLMGKRISRSHPVITGWWRRPGGRLAAGSMRSQPGSRRPWAGSSRSWSYSDSSAGKVDRQPRGSLRSGWPRPSTSRPSRGLPGSMSLSRPQSRRRWSRFTGDVCRGLGSGSAWHLGAAVAAAVAVLLKGPVGLALIGPTAVVFLLVERWRHAASGRAAYVWVGRMGVQTRNLTPQPPSLERKGEKKSAGT
jgi:hypothetical protein